MFPPPAIDLLRPEIRADAAATRLDLHRREALALQRAERRAAWARGRAALRRALAAWWRARGPDDARPAGQAARPAPPAGPIPLSPRRAGPRDAAGSPAAPRRAA